jgi:hypothetical protein
MSQRILKCFNFEERFRSRLTFSDASKIRLNSTTNPGRPQLQLAVQSYNRVTGESVYPLDTDLTVTTRVENPDTLKQLLGFNPTPRDALQPAGTTVRYKINDGTNDRYWDGGAWSIAGAGDWNSALVVVQNIDTYPVTSQQFGLVINMLTTDETVTPSLYFVDVLMDCQIDYFRSILADALIPSIRNGLQVPLDFVMSAPGGTILNLLDVETKYNVQSVEAVYDHTSDPNHATDLFSSYDSASEVITLSAPIARGNAAWLIFTSEPEVSLNWPSQDYTEVKSLPAVVIDTVELIGNEIWGEQAVKNADANTASVRRFPLRLRIELGVRLLAEKNRTLLAMLDRALSHVAETPLLPWPAVDEQISMRTLTEGLFQQRPNLSGVHETGYTLVLDDVHLFLRPEETKYLVQQLNITLSTPGLEGGPKWTDTKTGSPC